MVVGSDRQRVSMFCNAQSMHPNRNGKAYVSVSSDPSDKAIHTHHIDRHSTLTVSRNVRRLAKGNEYSFQIQKSSLISLHTLAFAHVANNS